MEITSKHIDTINDFMAKSGLNETDLAKRAGISQKALNDWRRGRAKTARYSNWAKMCAIVPGLAEDTPAPSIFDKFAGEMLETIMSADMPEQTKQMLCRKIGKFLIELGNRLQEDDNGDKEA